MAAISTRLPAVKVEYTKNGVRVTKEFADAYKARSFYAAQFKKGADPKVLRV